MSAFSSLCALSLSLSAYMLTFAHALPTTSCIDCLLHVAIRYSGLWKEGKQHGNGNFTFGGNGCTFEGEFVNGEVQEADLARWEAAKNHL